MTPQTCKGRKLFPVDTALMEMSLVSSPAIKHDWLEPVGKWKMLILHGSVNMQTRLGLFAFAQLSQQCQILLKSLLVLPVAGF